MKSKHIRTIFLAVLPVALFIIGRSRYESTPQYAYRSLLRAMQEQNLGEIERLTTAQGFHDLCRYDTFEDPLHQTLENKMKSLHRLSLHYQTIPILSLKWRQADPEQAQVIKHFVHGPSYTLKFRRMPEGWKVVRAGHLDEIAREDQRRLWLSHKIKSYRYVLEVLTSSLSTGGTVIVEVRNGVLKTIKPTGQQWQTLKSLVRFDPKWFVDYSSIDKVFERMRLSPTEEHAEATYHPRLGYPLHVSLDSRVPRGRSIVIIRSVVIIKNFKILPESPLF